MILQPLKTFVEEENFEWETREEFIAYNSAHSRFRIIVEKPIQASMKHGFIGLWRDEQLAEKNIDANCEDAKEFAQELLNGAFMHLSPHDLMHLNNAITKYLKDWELERSKALNIPVRDEFCKD